MESAILFSQVSSFEETAAAHASRCIAALQRQRQAITCEIEQAFVAHTAPTGGKTASPKEDTTDKGPGEGGCSSSLPRRVNLLKLHAMHRRRLYLQYAEQFAHLADTHAFYKLLMWCHDHHLFIHPSVRVVRRRSEFRDHIFFVSEDVPRLTPLLAIPEHLTIGFKDANVDNIDGQNNLYDAQRTKEFHALNSGGGASEEDVCQFFFNSLGMLVSDLVTARSSPLSDLRCRFAESLSKLYTEQNAPYFEDDVVFNPVEPCLADVLLQMIRNYIRGGPLVNKIPMHELQWAVSICLSHSTPLCIDSVRSIGILPIIHTFPHGGEKTNAYLAARTSRRGASAKMSAFFRNRFGYDFDSIHGGRWIYLLPERSLKAGEEIHVQAMAPICDKDDVEAQQMWRLSCGRVPASYKSTVEVAERQAKLTAEVISLGEEYLAKEQKSS